MKYYELVLFLSIFYILNCSLICDGTTVASNYNECSAFKLPEGAEHCCFIHLKYESNIKEQDINICSPLSKEDFANFENWKTKYRNEKEKDGFKLQSFDIDCGNSKNPKIGEKSEFLLSYGTDCEYTKNPKSIDDCKYNDVYGNYAYCCFIDVEYSKGGEKICKPLTLNEYNNIQKYYSELENNYTRKYGNVTKLDINCDPKAEPTPKSYCNDKESASSVDDCKNLDLEEGMAACCYLSAKMTYSGQSKQLDGCKSISQEDYNNQNAFVEREKM